jgi:dipeptide transport system substrate-binding protein
MKYLLALIYLFSFSHSYGSTFIYCSEGSPSAFNPQVTSDGTSNNAAAHTIFERLITFKEGTTELEPALALSWNISKDKKVYTFNLRRDVAFHKTPYFSPTRLMKADDVLFSFNRMRLKTHPFYAVGGAKYEYFNGMDMAKIIKDIIKVSDYKVAIHLTKPDAPFLANMAMSFMSIISKEHALQLTKQNKKEDIDHKPIGTGPFTYYKYKKDNIIRYKLHHKYWGTKPLIKKLVFSITPDASVRVQKLKAGECDLIASPPPNDLDQLEKDPNITVVGKPGMNVGYLAMNTQKKPLHLLKVRQAINHALNKKSYLKAIYLGKAKIAKNPLPPTLWSYNNQVKDYDYNPKKARKLLKDAGFPKGFDIELWTLPVSRPYNPNGKKMGELMQADLAQVGIRVNLITYDWPTYLNKSNKGQHSLLQLGWTGDNGDPDNFLHILLGCQGVAAGSNVAKWCHQPFNKLIEQAKITSDQKKRSKLYQKAQVIFKAQAPWVTLAHAKIYRAMRKNITGYIVDPLGGDIFRTVQKN